MAKAKTKAKKKVAKKAAPKTKGKAGKTAKVKLVAAPEPKKPAKAKGPRKSNGRSLLVVESPAKAKTIKKYLGRLFTVKASVGHIKDLPKSKLGVDLEKNFKPTYVVIKNKEKVLQEIRKAAGSVDNVFLAPDPDREGEAIAWHIADSIRDVNPNIQRVLINEITKKGVTEAIARPTKLDEHKYDAQQSRRILDRLVGYNVSPILWNKVKRGLSAGRVQSVAVRLICEREREIAAFIPEEYWTVEGEVEGKLPPAFAVRLVRWLGEKADRVPNGQIAGEAVAEIKSASLSVEKVERKERRRRPQPPFITSRLQQDAARKLRFTAKQTMGFAQRLYEGVDLGAEEGPVGLITYMRTDSVRLSDDAVTEARAYIQGKYGDAFVPPEPIVYKSAKQAQGAHEAIRPTSMKYDPETVRKLLIDPVKAKLEDPATSVSKKVELSSDLDDFERALKLYRLIWNRFVACQMTDAVYDQTTVDIAAGRATLRANGQILKFAGFTKVYIEADSDDEAAAKAEEQDKLLPELTEGEPITLKKIEPEQHFTQPPPRFSEASLVKELEEKGIGRPSTYAAIMSTIQDRGYVEKKEARFWPTELGTMVNDLVVNAFPDIFNVEFTAGLELKLDEVEEGRQEMNDVLRDFYTPFKKDLATAEEKMPDIKREERPTDLTCEKCGSPMVIKWGKRGWFLACKSYPECKTTRDYKELPGGKIEIIPEKVTDEKCEVCGSPMLYKTGRFGDFLACSRYPECKATKAVSLGVNCPKPGCGGYLTEKRSRRGKVFFGCSNYSKTKCDFVSWDRPFVEECPQCHAPFLVKKETKRGATIRCLTKDCGYLRREGEAEEPVEADGASA